MTASQWRFESFRLDPVNACLWWGTEAVVVTPKTFDVLHYLVRHADRLVTKDELLDAVWPETAVSDGVVRMAISALRKALDDTAQTPRFIATVPRRGYRFVAAVTRTEPPVAPRTGELQPLTSLPPRHEHGPLAHTLTAPAEQSHTARAALEGERKQVTVLFADITDSLALIRTLDPEATQQLLDPALQRMMDAVHHYAGTVNQVLGDGLMALFGAPLAYEDHALRACYAALAMQAALREYATKVHRTHGVALRIRIGLNSGEVVARALRNDVQLEYSAVGATTHLAARMEEVATPGTIVLTAATGRLVEGLVRLKALGPVPVKGLPEPLAVYELLGVSALQGRFQAAVARGLTRLVGREAALASVRQALERAATGHGQVVAVLGEAGMGKSRLVHECLQQLDLQGWRVLTSAALSYTQATPYFPVVTLLKQYFHLDDGAAPAQLNYTSTHCRPPVSRRSCGRAWATTPAWRHSSRYSSRTPRATHSSWKRACGRSSRHMLWLARRAPIGSCNPCRRCRCLLPYRPSSQPVSIACRRTINGCCKRRRSSAWTCPCPCCTRCWSSRRRKCRPAWRRCKRPSFSTKRSSSPKLSTPSSTPSPGKSLCSRCCTVPGTSCIGRLPTF